jgi:hypothetical protein
MGQTNGKLDSVNSYESLLEEMNTLLSEYKPWTNKEICNQMVIVYKNKLSDLSTNDLMNLSVSIGIQHPKQAENKEQLCGSIINHYLMRIALLNEITSEMKKCYEDINACISGEICLNVNDVITDIIECQKNDGLWVDKEMYGVVIQNMKLNGNYRIWLSYVKSLDTIWDKYIKKIHRMIKLIKNDRRANNDNIFNILKNHCHDILRKMKYVIKIYCLIVANFGKL